MPLFDLPAEKVRVVQMETGGGFGGKEEYPSMIAGHAALLAWKSGKPVKIDLRPRRGHGRDHQAPSVADAASDGGDARREADRDGHRLRHRRRRVLHAVAGRALARHDSRGGSLLCARMCGVRSRAVATNSPPHGAFRGFGAPQSIFALERHMDRVAAASALRPTSSGGAILSRTGRHDAVGQVIARAGRHERPDGARVRAADYHAKRARFDASNPSLSGQEGHRARVLHARRRIHRLGRGSPDLGRRRRGDGRRPCPGAVGEHRDRPGHQHDLRADRGRHARRRLDAIEIAQPDTAAVPNSGPTVASRTCMVVGKLVESAARGFEPMLETLDCSATA